MVVFSSVLLPHPTAPGAEAEVVPPVEPDELHRYSDAAFLQ
jgi:hypothetical protein